MTEKTDLRVIKTRKNIREAFLTLRSKHPLDKIKVRDICTLALINSSTFYNHYTDVFGLSDEIENEILHDCFENFADKDCLFTDPMRFLANVPRSLEVHKDELEILFRDRWEHMYLKLESQLRAYYRQKGADTQQDILLTFVIGGTMRTMQAFDKEKLCDVETLNLNIAQIIDKIK